VIGADGELSYFVHHLVFLVFFFVPFVPFVVKKPASTNLSENHPPDAILEPDLVEVHQQADGLFCQPHIGQQLGLMDRQ
jgi:hypothetical protein